jgi:dGTPase
MEWADDIAYSVHDLEDGLHSGLILPELFTNPRLLERIAAYADAKGAPGCDGDEVRAYVDGLFTRLIGGTARHIKEQRKRLTSTLIHRFVTHTTLEARPHVPAYPLTLHVEPAILREVAILKAVEYVLLIRNPRVTTLEYKGKLIVTNLFRALAQDDSGDLFPDDIREAWEEVRDVEDARLRVVCDYIAGMTDGYALRLYARLFEPGVGSIHDAF